MTGFASVFAKYVLKCCIFINQNVLTGLNEGTRTRKQCKNQEKMEKGWYFNCHCHMEITYH